MNLPPAHFQYFVLQSVTRLVTGEYVYGALPNKFVELRCCVTLSRVVEKLKLRKDP